MVAEADRLCGVFSDRGLDPARTVVAVRHLPVVSGERLLSMLSVRDLMRVAIEDRGAEIEYLREYLYRT